MTIDYRKDLDWSEVENPMTDDEIREWIAALRSGKYKQGQKRLVTEEGYYCCLGVEIVIHNITPGDSILIRNFNEDSSVYLRLPRALQDELAALNDGGRTFKRIALKLKKGFHLK